jgi:putative glutamine amidotransferase
MQSRPVIGIVTETIEPASEQAAPAWIMEHRYIQGLTALGAVPWLIPLLQGDGETLESIYVHLDGVFLAGGVDVDPQCYREKRLPQCGRTDPPRDWTEMRLIRWALRDHKPLLGICRGIQMINVAAGGTLYQDVPTQLPTAIPHDCDDAKKIHGAAALFHEVQVQSGSQLHELFGAEAVEVNSMHHQAIRDLAPDLAPTAFSPDGLIEGIEGMDRNRHYLVAVQWHPEEMLEKSSPMRQLFQSFLDAAAGHKNGRSA